MKNPPRHDPSGMTPPAESGRKVLIYNILTFSSSSEGADRKEIARWAILGRSQVEGEP